MQLRTVNLNLMPILRALLRERSVARAAAVLGLSRSATSEALGRLRETLGDPLLVRTGRAMVLTPRAAAMIGGVEDLCASAERLLNQAPFDPAKSTRVFAVATSDYGAALVAPAILRLRKAQAPGVSVRFADAHHDVAARLGSGDFDFAVLARFYLQDMTSSALRFAVLARHPLVAIVREGHAVAVESAPSLETLEAWPLIGVVPEPGVLEPGRQEAIYSAGRFALAAELQHVSLLPGLVADSDCWAIVPEGVARALTREAAIVQRPLPFPADPVEMCLVWSIANDSDAAHAWFRREVTCLLHRSAEPMAALGTIDYSEHLSAP